MTKTFRLLDALRSTSAWAKSPSTAEFPEPGVSQKADEVYGLIKAGVVKRDVDWFPTDQV